MSQPQRLPGLATTPIQQIIIDPTIQPPRFFRRFRAFDPSNLGVERTITKIGQPTIPTTAVAVVVSRSRNPKKTKKATDVVVAAADAGQLQGSRVGLGQRGGSGSCGTREVERLGKELERDTAVGEGGRDGRWGRGSGMMLRLLLGLEPFLDLVVQKTK